MMASIVPQGVPRFWVRAEAPDRENEDLADDRDTEVRGFEDNFPDLPLREDRVVVVGLTEVERLLLDFPGLLLLEDRVDVLRLETELDFLVDLPLLEDGLTPPLDLLELFFVIIPP